MYSLPVSARSLVIQETQGGSEAQSSSDTPHYWRDTMSGTSDKIKGMANEAVGNVKQGVGKATGNEKLQVEGKIQENKGEAQQVVGKVKDAVDQH